MAGLLCVILNWRSAPMTLRAAEAALVALRGMDAALVLVDNASGDGSYEAMAGWAGGRGVRVVQAGRNGGFGAGNNAGIRAGMPDGAQPDYVYILNSDAFPAPDAIRALRDHLESHPKTGFAGSFIHGEDGTPHRTAFRFPSIAGEFEAQARLGPVSRLLRGSIVAQEIPQVTGRVDWLAGASLMMRQAVLDQIGLFDERFFLYFEETDLCHRAAKAGWPTDYVLESRVAHIGSASTGMKQWARIPAFWLDSRMYYFTKTHGALYAGLATKAHVAGGCLWRLRRWVERKPLLDPPLYLRDLTAHALRRFAAAMWPGALAKASKELT